MDSNQEEWRPAPQFNGITQHPLSPRKNVMVELKIGGSVRWKHGHASHSLGATPTYHSWLSMRSRCKYVERDISRKHVGRGITVCERWEDFENFLADMGERPEGTSLDRIDNDGNYEPGNCRWATPREQSRNTRRNKLTFDTAVEVAIARLRGEPARQIAERYGISESLPREIVKGRTWPDALAAAKQSMEASNGD